MISVRAAAAGVLRGLVLGERARGRVELMPARRGAMFLVSLLVVACATSTVRYRACFEPPPTAGVAQHFPGTVVGKLAPNVYRFEADAARGEILRITCSECINPACSHARVGIVDGNVAAAARDAAREETR